VPRTGSRSTSSSDRPLTPIDRLARTRSLAGARVAVWAPLLLGPALAAAAPPDPGPLPWRVGGRVGFTVDAARFPDDAGDTLDVYVRIPPATLAALQRDSLGVGRLKLTARLRSGARSLEQVQEYAIQPNDTTAGFGHVVGLRFAVTPGVRRLAVRLEDPRSQKVGLIYSGRKVPEAGSIEGAIKVPPRGEGRDLSGLEFVWAAADSATGSSFERAGRTLVPNPERLYGLYARHLRVGFLGVAASPGPWTWNARVLDHGTAVLEARDSTTDARLRLDGALAFDVSRLAAGGYDLELEVRCGPGPPLVRRERFNVAWLMGSWLRNPRDVEDDVHFLLTPDQEDGFALLSAGEQERILTDFWQVRDPSPGTPENEARTTFTARVEHANQHWSRPGLGKGMFSDMGRVYIRYGEPSEIMNQVMPTGDETVDLAITQIQSNEDRAIGGVDERGPGIDMRPYEMWYYDPPVPAPFDADPKVARRVRQKRLVFLFVDERGLGDYRLRYSTE
jgi:GWxTD domain-containing protein